MAWGGKQPATPPRQKAYLPTEAEIADLCRQFQAGWSPDEERQRRLWTLRRLEVARGRLR
jgi:hypothetical protein